VLRPTSAPSLLASFPTALGRKAGLGLEGRLVPDMEICRIGTLPPLVHTLCTNTMTKSMQVVAPLCRVGQI